jgi:hypothetical protein
MAAVRATLAELDPSLLEAAGCGCAEDASANDSRAVVDGILIADAITENISSNDARTLKTLCDRLRDRQRQTSLQVRQPLPNFSTSIDM